MCTAADIVYSMTVAATTGLSTTFITFTPSTMTVAWVTTNNAQVGIYTITVIGKNYIGINLDSIDFFHVDCDRKLLILH